MISYLSICLPYFDIPFFYLPGFIKKKKEATLLFSKETVIFLYKVKFSGNKDIDLGDGRTRSVTHGWESVLQTHTGAHSTCAVPRMPTQAWQGRVHTSLVKSV